MAHSRKLLVFLCHSSGDKPAMRELYKPYPYRAEDGRGKEEGLKRLYSRVLHGGSFGGGSHNAWAACRHVNSPSDVFDFYGSSVALAPPLS
jgi:hypothetical protein